MSTVNTVFSLYLVESKFLNKFEERYDEKNLALALTSVSLLLNNIIMG